MKKWLGLILLAGVAAAAAQDFYSEEYYEGVYWDPNTPGEGFTFDTQNGTGFMTIYSYDSQGDPTFFTAIGAINTEGKGEELPVFDAEVYRTRNFTDSEPVGLLRIYDRQGDLDRLTMQWDEREIPLRRFIYAYPPEPLGRLTGTWLFITLEEEVAQGAGILDVIAIDGTLMQDSRGSYMDGQTLTLSSERTRIYYEGGEYVAVTPFSNPASATSVWRFKANENVMTGFEFDGDADGIVGADEGVTMFGYRLSFLDLFAEDDSR